MIKVCHFTSTHPPYDGRIFYKECCSLVKMGYDVYLVAPGTKDELRNGVHILGVKYEKKGRIRRMLCTANSVYKKALSLNADVYHFRDPDLLRFASKLKRRGKKVIYDMHKDYPVNIMTKTWIPSVFRKFVSWAYVRYETKVLKLLDAVIVVTPHMEKRLEYVKKVKLVTNYPLLDGCEDIKKNDDYLKRENILTFAGTISTERLHHNLIKAIEDIENVKYVLAGRANSYLESLKSLPAWQKVIYLGVITQEEVEDLYRRTKIGIIIENYCAVNYDDEGSLGVTKLFEYMKCSIPFICTDFKYHKDIVDKYKCGICVNPLNIKEITGAILYLLKHQEEAMQMGRNGYKAYMEKYNWQSQESELLDLYEKVCD